MRGGDKGEHYDVSVKCGERVLLPKVRETAENTLIITSGFSCREQIHQGAQRRAHHLAEVMQMALKTGSREEAPTAREEHREKPAPHTEQEKPRSWRRWIGIGAAAAASAGAIWKTTRDRDGERV